MVLVDPAGRTATDPDCAEGDDTCVQEKGQPKKKDQSVDVLGTLGQALDYIGSETSQRLSNLAQDTLQVIQNVRRDPNCAVNLTAGGFAAGAGFGFYTGGFTVGTAGALAGSLELPGFGTFSVDVGGFTVGATGGASVFGIAGSAAGHLGAQVCCLGPGGGGGGGGGAGGQQYKNRSPTFGAKTVQRTFPVGQRAADLALTNENGKQFAQRLCDVKYGRGNYSTQSQSEFAKIEKWVNGRSSEVLCK